VANAGRRTPLLIMHAVLYKAQFKPCERIRVTALSERRACSVVIQARQAISRAWPSTRKSCQCWRWSHVLVFRVYCREVGTAVRLTHTAECSAQLRREEARENSRTGGTLQRAEFEGQKFGILASICNVLA